MKSRAQFEMPPEKERLNQRAVRLEWLSIGFLLSITVVMYLVMGSSQAMKAAWLEDVLSLVAPIAFLIASRVRNREPNENFPYGYHRAVSIAFMVASLALLGIGLFMVYDASSKLIKMEHPTIGLVEIFGRQIWSGWLMIAALIYSALPPVILGRMKLPLARELHDKTLHADAATNKADWLTAVAGIFGILGIGIGWWWADGTAALFISLEVLRDGFSNVSSVVKDLMDQQPTTVDQNEPDQITERVLAEVKSLPWVRDAALRLREEGHLCTGELFVVPVDDDDLISRMGEASDTATRADWRVYDIVTMPVASLADLDRR